MNNTETTQELATRLALAMRPCPPIGTGPNGECTRCNGTAEVYTFPDSVRRPCPGIWWRPPGAIRNDELHEVASEGDHLMERDHPRKCRCGGSGWVGSQRLETWIEALCSFPGTELGFRCGGAIIHITHDDGSREQSFATGPPLEALLRALAKFMARP